MVIEGVKNTGTISFAPFDAAETLDNEEMIAVYLNDVVMAGDEHLFQLPIHRAEMLTAQVGHRFIIFIQRSQLKSEGCRTCLNRFRIGSACELPLIRNPEQHQRAVGHPDEPKHIGCKCIATRMCYEDIVDVPRI